MSGEEKCGRKKQRGRESLFSRSLLQVAEIPWTGDVRKERLFLINHTQRGETHDQDKANCQWRLANCRILLERQGHGLFKAPSVVQKKVRYAVRWFGFDLQKQTLNGRDFKKLEVGLGSLGYARMQVLVSQTTDVTYDVYGDGVARLSPEVPF
jgi:hypothetical protein